MTSGSPSPWSGESREGEAEARAEAALYAAGRPLSLDSLMQAAGLTSKRRTLVMMRKLAQHLNSALGAIEVVEMNEHKFVMQLNPRFMPVARRFATRPLVPDGAMKTLAYIAYYQPISSAQLAQRRGHHVYGHLHLLEETDFVRAEAQGRVKIYRTTPSFSDYFGLSRDPAVLREQIASRSLTPRAKA